MLELWIAVLYLGAMVMGFDLGYTVVNTETPFALLPVIPLLLEAVLVAVCLSGAVCGTALVQIRQMVRDRLPVVPSRNAEEGADYVAMS